MEEFHLKLRLLSVLRISTTKVLRPDVKYVPKDLARDIYSNPGIYRRNSRRRRNRGDATIKKDSSKGLYPGYNASLNWKFEKFVRTRSREPGDRSFHESLIRRIVTRALVIRRNIDFECSRSWFEGNWEGRCLLFYSIPLINHWKSTPSSSSWRISNRYPFFFVSSYVTKLRWWRHRKVGLILL